MNSSYRIQHQAALSKALDAAGIKEGQHRNAWYASGLPMDPTTNERPPDPARIEAAVQRLRERHGPEL